MYVYKHFELIFVVFTTLFTTYFDKIITTDLPKSHNPVKSVHFIQILSIVLANFTYYTGTMLSAFAFYYAQNYAGIMGSSLAHSTLVT